MFNYSFERLDVIKELSNIALGNSATSLSELLNASISMSVPDINIESIGDFINGIENIEVIGKIIIIRGDIEGSILILFGIDTAKKIISNSTLLPKNKLLSQDELDDLKISFIDEICNIVGSTYIRNIADFLNLNIEIENSTFLYDDLTAILSHTFMEEEQFQDDIFNIQTDFKYELNSECMNVYFYFVPRQGNIDKIFNKKSKF